MRTRLPLLALLFLASACADKPATETAAQGAAQTSAPPTAEAPADPAEVARRRIAEVDSLQKSHPEQVKVFAKAPGREGFVPVPDSLSWPDEVESSINVWTDAAGRPLALMEAPFSESGDWVADFTHFFDEQGRTVAFRNQSSWFISGCTEIMRMDERRLYRPGLVLIRADSTFTDAGGKPLASREECQILDLAGDWGITVLEGYEALVRAGRAPALPPR